MMPNLLNKETIESIYECATDILETVGVEFDMFSARELFKKNGEIFDKRGMISDGSSSKASIHINADKEINRRCAAYILPERSKMQKELLSKYLPTQCSY